MNDIQYRTPKPLQRAQGPVIRLNDANIQRAKLGAGVGLAVGLGLGVGLAAVPLLGFALALVALVGQFLIAVGAGVGILALVIIGCVAILKVGA